MEFIDHIRESAAKRTIYSFHALEEMSAESEMIRAEEVRHVIFNGEIIENYPEDKRGHSCLLLGISAQNRPLHVVCAPKEGYLAIITAYIPALEKWEAGFRTRRKK